MKKYRFILLFAFLHTTVVAQIESPAKRFRIGIFSSLYLDSSFMNGVYKFDKQMPRHILPGLDFTKGALMAADSLKTNVQLEYFIFDVKSEKQSIGYLKTIRTFDSLDLIIGSVAGNDYKQLAEQALLHGIPFISSTYPNDGGISNNPFTIIVNTTLPTHCEAIYNYILRTFPTANILYFRKSGIQEDKLSSYFEKQNKAGNGKALLKWQTLWLKDSANSREIEAKLDSQRVNVIIAGSLEEKFAQTLLKSVAPLIKQYPIELIGMPTWESMKELSLPQWKDFPIYYTTTFFNTGTSKWSQFTNQFTILTEGKPSDLAYKGYEQSWYFTNLLLKYENKFFNYLNDKSFYLFTEYNIKPVINLGTGKPDYYENKKIYLLKRKGGLISRMN